MAAERAEQVKPRDPVVDPVGDFQGLGEKRPCLTEVTAEQRGGPQVEKHHLQPVHVTGRAGETQALRGA